MSEFKLKEGINKCTNSEYHGDKSYLSSSSLKTLLKSPAQFYEEQVLGNKKPLEGAFLDEGTLTHSLILEPETVEAEFAFFEGMRKQGKEWEEFKAENGNKMIMSKPQKVRCEAYVEAYRQRKEAVALIKNGEAEHTICAELLGMPIKTRSDYINVEQGYIVDVKTTSFPSDKESFQLTIKEYQYDLSAALYLAVAEKYYEKSFDFYFVVLGKKDLKCEVFKLSKRSRHEGMAKIAKAARIYKQCLTSGKWESKIEKVIKTDYVVLEV